MSTIAELEDKVKELLDEIEALKREKAEEFEYPFKRMEQYCFIDNDGKIIDSAWTNHNLDTCRYEQGNIFKTEREAERERDRRALLTRIRQFRDKCNGDWKPDFESLLQDKYTIRCDYGLKQLFLYGETKVYEFSLFGYFKNFQDTERAIELFGDEIIRLYVEVKQ